MKLIAIVFAILIPFTSLAQVSITIQGKVLSKGNYKQVYFYEQTQTRRVPFDSVAVTAGGSFFKKFSTSKPGVYLIGLNEFDNVPFWADKENLVVQFIEKKPVQIVGGKGTALIHSFNQLMQEQSKQMSSNDPKVNRAEIQKNYKTRLISLINAHAEEPAVIYALRMLDRKADDNFLKEISAKLTKANPNSLVVADFVFDLSRLDLGKPATEIEYLTVKGEKSSLKNSLGKARYTLVDFWGTYCIPCREGIPGIKKLYAQYQSKGFDVLAISLDTKNDIWMKSLAEEQMPWSQGRTTDGGRKVMADYRFSGIPYLALFDQKGNIVALGLQHDELEQKLEDLMGKPDPVVDTDKKSKAYEASGEASLIQQILNTTDLESYLKCLSALDENTFKSTYLKNLGDHIQMKDYQISKLGWSLPTYFKRYQEVLNSGTLSKENKLKTLREIDQNEMGLVRLVLEHDQYEKYLGLRLSKKLLL
ncbi:TlpA disulfide reductase family protein [Pedobacter sp.]|jgi:thiol-disulfide isomerase/thioredoxin|uniref:TlpA disulfide reductase family protein n=1 Tax=Pedobacter sp. TaxID=1411316 RepID=UPI002C49956C|nr:TlpA disulfide reductase family protein [Pedobacter sp.]HWW40177.1 TlpA disulfide reductase family protein [Pedobacter sp.]